MDSMGSLVDTNLRIFPSKCFLDYLKTIHIDDNVPLNIARLVKGKTYEAKSKAFKDVNTTAIHLDSNDIKNLNKIKAIVKVDDPEVKEEVNLEEKDSEDSSKDENINKDENNKKSNKDKSNKSSDKDKKNESSDNNKKNVSFEKAKPEDKPKDKKKLNTDDAKVEDKLHLTTADIDWLYTYLQQQRKTKADGDKVVPYLHTLLEGAEIETPENQVLKRNPVLEARCVKLRAQQEARDYRKMTKSVDNVRMRFPEDSISYQLKQMNRQLIAIGQFIISIFAGFLFGFRGVEWMVGNLDFGFRLLLGVMCALVIALAEIYFLAKKLNEELNVPETVQLGGPPKFADQSQYYVPKPTTCQGVDKEHQD